MGEWHYKTLVRIALVMTVAWIGWSLYELGPRYTTPASQDLSAASRHLEDGHYRQALALFSEVYDQDKENLGALRGMAQSQMQLGLKLIRDGASGKARLQQALALYDRAIAAGRMKLPDAQQQRILGVSHANRGILRDHMGDHRGALEDYTESLKFAPQVAEGPGWFTRFLHNQAERPADISQRADYLRNEFNQPESERLLRLPAVDARQRSYTMD